MGSKRREQEVLSVKRIDDILCRARCSDCLVTGSHQAQQAQSSCDDAARWVLRGIVERGAQCGRRKRVLPETFATSLCVGGASHLCSMVYYRFIGVASISFSGSR